MMKYATAGRMVVMDSSPADYDECFKFMCALVLDPYVGSHRY